MLHSLPCTVRTWFYEAIKQGTSLLGYATREGFPEEEKLELRLKEVSLVKEVRNSCAEAPGVQEQELFEDGAAEEDWGDVTSTQVGSVQI